MTEDLKEKIIGVLIPNTVARFTDESKSVIEVVGDQALANSNTGVVVAPSFFMTHDLITFYNLFFRYGRVFVVNHSETEVYESLVNSAARSLRDTGVENFHLISASMGIVIADYLLQSGLPFVNYTTLGPIEKGANGIASTAASFLSWVGRKGPMGLFHAFTKIEMDGAPIPVQEYYKTVFPILSPEVLSRRFAVATKYINQKLSDNPITTPIPTTAVFGERELPFTSYNPERFSRLFPNSKIINVPGGHTNYMHFTKEYTDAIIQGMENL